MCQAKRRKMVLLVLLSGKDNNLGDRVNDKMLCTLSFVLENYSIKTAHAAASSRAAPAVKQSNVINFTAK